MSAQGSKPIFCCSGAHSDTSAFRSDRSKFSASSSFFSTSASPFSSCSVVQGTFFIASTAAPNSLSGTSSCFFSGGRTRSCADSRSPESLKNYDGVAFVSTTGELPIPDPQGLLDWIKAGHAFIGIHAASDTFHKWPGYIDMLGGEFDHHGAQLSVEVLNEDPQHPANAALGKTWTLTREEMYQFKNYDPTRVHDLLDLDKKPERPFTPGHFPVSWCKSYGNGKVFYTSLGHREDIIDPDPNLANRVNSVEISKAYDAHILNGIEWALGLKKSKSVP